MDKNIESRDAPDPASPATAATGIPAVLYVVASLFLAKGFAGVISTLHEVITRRHLDLGDIAVGLILVAIGAGLFGLKPSAHGWAKIVLTLGIVFRALIAFMISLFYVDDFRGKLSGLPDDSPPNGGNVGVYVEYLDLHLRREYTVSDGPISWQLSYKGMQRPLTGRDVALLLSTFVGAIALNVWQLVVLKRPHVRVLFGPAQNSRQHPYREISFFYLGLILPALVLLHLSLPFWFSSLFSDIH